MDPNEEKNESHTNKEGSRKGPFLSTTHDWKRKPVCRNEWMENRYGGDSSDCGQIFGGETIHW